MEWLNSIQVNEELMFLAGSEFGAQPITLPENNHIQRADGNPIAEAQGIFYAPGNGEDQANIIDPNDIAAFQEALLGFCLVNCTTNYEPTWFGGIYVKGDVNNIILTTDPGGEQKMVIEHSNGSNVEFLRGGASEWKVIDTDKDGNATHGYLNGRAFNGLIYVDGQVGCYQRRDGSSNDSNRAPSSDVPCSDKVNGLKGDGTDAPDLNKDFMLTVTATSHIVIKEDITYSSLPFCVDDEDFDFNVLGLFSSEGNIEVDGPTGTDITVHATMMASGVDNGFGTLEHANGRGNGETINITGGVIHHTDQAVGTFGGGRGTGYGRNWEFDCRLENGLAPPFFPTQIEWDKRTSFKGLNNRAVWRLN